MLYGLIGEKLGHSYSKLIHDKLGAYPYDLFPLSREALTAVLTSRDFKGLNVTIPYKQTVMPYCDVLSPLAEDIGAVNTLYFDEQNRLCGTNTDYYGFIYAMKNAHIEVSHKKVLILGDGATCKTVRKAVSDMGAKEILIASRHGSSETVSYEGLTAHSDVEIIINTTPVGMYPNTENSPVDLTQFPECCGVFDVIYNPYYTKLLLQAKELKLPCAGGLAMLVAQATASAEFFSGKSFESENPRILSELKAAICDV